jgi:hypothetical protein
MGNEDFLSDVVGSVTPALPVMTCDGTVHLRVRRYLFFYSATCQLRHNAFPQWVTSVTAPVRTRSESQETAIAPMPSLCSALESFSYCCELYISAGPYSCRMEFRACRSKGDDGGRTKILLAVARNGSGRAQDDAGVIVVADVAVVDGVTLAV